MSFYDKLMNVTIEPRTPLILHNDDIIWSDRMAAWRTDPENQKWIMKGDDRSPAWTWVGYLHHDEEHVAIPQDMIMACLRHAGAMIPVPGQGKKTFKSQTQSGIRTVEQYWKLQVNGKYVDIKDVHALIGEMDFEKHLQFAKDHDFMLFVKRVKIGQSKHVRVRPRFDNWKVEGQIRILDEQLSEDVVNKIWEFAGTNKGWGDWRPGAPAAGNYGMYRAILKAA